MAGEVLLTISRDEIERARLMSEYKYELDTQSKVVQAKREGRQEADAEHREQHRQDQERIRRLEEELRKNGGGGTLRG
jgi:hypothetical protein